MSLADRWTRLLLLALASGSLAFLTALAIVMSQNGQTTGNALLVYGP
jgi:hypothetical protein